MKIYLIGGKARHGKDTLGNFMKEYYEGIDKKVCIMHISNYFKQLVKDYFGWDGKEETKPRTLLQTLGTDIIRKKMGKENYALDRLIEDIAILENFFDVIIVTDIRLPKEYESIKEAYPEALKIHIKRENFTSSLTKEEQKHTTEVALDNYKDYDIEVINDTLEGLKKDAIRIIKEEEKL